MAVCQQACKLAVLRSSLIGLTTQREGLRLTDWRPRLAQRRLQIRGVVKRFRLRTVSEPTDFRQFSFLESSCKAALRANRQLTPGSALVVKI